MKRYIAFLLAALMCTNLCACGAEQTEPEVEEVPVEEEVQEQPVPEEPKQEEVLAEPVPEEPKVIEYQEAEEINFTELLAEVSEKHKEVNTAATSFEGFEDYLVEDPSAKGLLTYQEIQAIQGENPKVDSLTYEQAVADIDLYFRTLKYGYGAYYYFGGDEVFDAAKESALSRINGKENVDYNELESAIKQSVNFIRDGHFGINGPTLVTSRRYVYLYCEGQEFNKDENGFYKVSTDGEKWYFISCDNVEVSIVPSLNQEGKLIYSPILFSTKSNWSSVITLSNGEETIEEEIKWIFSETYAESYHDDADYKFVKESGVAYISIRSFDTDMCYADLTQFVQDANKVRDAEVIIFDIRANGGGSSQWTNQWTAYFKGEPLLNMVHSNRNTALRDGGNYRALGYEEYTYGTTRGTFVANDIPIVLLVDSSCGSSGEDMLLRLMANENVIVVGSNSSGCDVCGNVMGFSLPNSGISFNFGASLYFYNVMENIDSKGYMPDVWCNPKDALDFAIELIRNYELVSTEALEAFETTFESQKPISINLRWDNGDNIILKPGVGFGRPQGTQTFTVLVDGEPYTDFQVVNEDDKVCKVEIIDGKIKLIPMVSGDSNLTIIIGNNQASFRWHKD
ncbi:MAG: hypothetical protein IJP15_00275 [Oscillospiraceae bacterium]|nr:hypothetical protein [Oscillospiraceae bacterium]